MESLQCLKALGLHEVPQSREPVEAAYEAKRRELRGDTESGKLASRLLEENYRMCLHLINTNE